MISLLRQLFFALVVKPMVAIGMGIHIRSSEKLPIHGPAIIAANHNSHLDTFVLMSLFPLRSLPILRPAAAADYFLQNKALAWFAIHMIGIIPLNRKLDQAVKEDPLQGCKDALLKNQIVILFPEGSRGSPEKMSSFKSGIAHLAKTSPETPIIPIFLHGCGKALPRGEMIFVPTICDINVGAPLFWEDNRNKFMEKLENIFHVLSSEINTQRYCDEMEEWDVDANP